MKRKIIYSAMLLVLTSMLAMQSCKKPAPVAEKEHFAFTTPTVVAPLNDSIATATGNTIALTWASSTPDGTAPLADVYFGTSPNPPLYQANVPALTLTVPVETGQKYYWSVIMKDAQGIRTYSPEFNFIVLGIELFTGDYTADEPAEDYSYDISFEKSSDTQLKTENYWNSGWEAFFTIDLTAKTYSMPLTTWGTWSGIESGTIDPLTGTMVGSYTIRHNGAVFEVGVHTYTKK